MAKSPATVLEELMQAQLLSILVFGPSTDRDLTDEKTSRIAAKRVQLRDALAAQGHTVHFGEDVFDPSLPPPANNPFLQERMIFSEYDLIIVLVSSPGSVFEAGTLASSPEHAPRCLFLLDEGHADGLAFQGCKAAETTYNARVEPFRYPNDIDSCRLATKATEVVRTVQITKFLTP